MKLTTTFALLRHHGACESGYRNLAQHLGGACKYGKDTPINLLTVLASNGVQDTLWCLRATVEDSSKAAVLLAASFAEEVLPLFEQAYPNDKRPRAAIEAARAWASGTGAAAVAWAADAAAAAADAVAVDRAAAVAWAADAAAAAADAAADAVAVAVAVDAAARAAWAAAVAVDRAAAVAPHPDRQAQIIRNFLEG